MSKKIIVICAMLFLGITAFSFVLSAWQDNAPEWVKQKMTEQHSGFLEFEKFNILTSEGKKFYIFYSSAEDGLDPIFDEDGKYICSRGGFGNVGDSKAKCPKFDQDK